MKGDFSCARSRELTKLTPVTVLLVGRRAEGSTDARLDIRAGKFLRGTTAKEIDLPRGVKAGREVVGKSAAGNVKSLDGDGTGAGTVSAYNRASAIAGMQLANADAESAFGDGGVCSIRE